MDFTPALSGAFSGILQGYQLAQAKKLQDAQIAASKTKSAVELGDQGYKIDEEGNPVVDPGFLDPNSPSFQRAKQAAAFKAMASPKTNQPYLSLGAVHAIRNPGKTLPPELEQYKDTPYDPKYDNLFTQGNLKPKDELASPDQQAEYERITGLKPGTAKGITVGQMAGGAQYIAGQNASMGRTSAVQTAENARNQARIQAEAARAAEGISARASLQDKSLAAQAERDRNKPTAVSKKLSDKYADYITGDRQAALGVIKDLEDSRDKLRSRGDSSWQSYAPGLVPFFDKDLEQIKTNIGDAASTGLKERFGSRISNLELQNAMKFSYNPHLTESQNADLLEKHIAQAKQKIAEKDRWARSFEQSGRAQKNYSIDEQGAPSGEEDLGPDTGAPPANPSALRAQAAQTGGAAVNGNIIPQGTIDAIKRLPDKGTQSAPKLGATKIVQGKKYVRSNRGWEEQL